MTSSGFAYPNLFGKSVPAPAPRWGGNAKFNFIGGHNDRALIPVVQAVMTRASQGAITSKAAMEAAGVIGSRYVRGPLLQADDDLVAQLLAALRTAGLAQ